MDIRGQNIKNYNVYTTKFNLYVVDLTQINRHQRRRLSETEITQTGKHMEKNYKLIIGYDGTRYFGWEHQPGKDTIQGKLEDVLNHLTEKPVLIIGAGRTDAGVHARAMAANVVLSVDMTAEQLAQCVTERIYVDDAGYYMDAEELAGWQSEQSSAARDAELEALEAEWQARLDEAEAAAEQARAEAEERVAQAQAEADERVAQAQADADSRVAEAQANAAA